MPVHRSRMSGSPTVRVQAPTAPGAIVPAIGTVAAPAADTGTIAAHAASASADAAKRMTRWRRIVTPLGAGAPCSGHRDAPRLPPGAGGSLETGCPRRAGTDDHR